MLKLSINKDPVLRKRSKKLDRVTDQDRDFIKKMFELMYKKNGIGLAAVQVGVLKQIITVDIGQGRLCLINPAITSQKGPSRKMEEGCLSLPDISSVKVLRPESITVEALDETGVRVRIQANDLLARVLQHEIDHLRGKLIIDYLPWHKRITSRI